MAASTAFLNACLAGTAGGITLLTYAGLSNSTPGTTGAGELSGGSYARQAITWSTPASASTGNSASISWSVAASTSNIGWVLLESAVSAGTYYDDLVIGTAVSFSSAGTLTMASSQGTLAASQAALFTFMPNKFMAYGPMDEPRYVGPEGGGLLLTGLATGMITVSDGTSYDVTPAVIGHAPGHAGELCHQIDLQHEVTGAADVYDTYQDLDGVWHRDLVETFKHGWIDDNDGHPVKRFGCSPFCTAS